MSKSTGIIIFICGAAVGAFLAWNHTKNKYERIVQEEIDSVKKTFSKKAEENNDSSGYTINEEDISDLSDEIVKAGYVSSDTVEDIPYVISPKEFGEFEDYETISLTYYADGILADDNDVMIDDVENIIGTESLDHFGEYEDDSVFVRNDRVKCDYEILMDQRKYSDVIKNKPYLMEDK
ncbi:MAG: hypothetical protein IJ192_13755 [Clostridia bacterium]|nr:hypothetical protein [Clostridia bacterium]